MAGRAAELRAVFLACAGAWSTVRRWLGFRGHCGALGGRYLRRDNQPARERVPRRNEKPADERVFPRLGVGADGDGASALCDLQLFILEYRERQSALWRFDLVP